MDEPYRRPIFSTSAALSAPFEEKVSGSEWVFIVGVVVAGPIVLVIMAKGFGGFLNSVQGIGSSTYRTDDQGILNRLPPNERRRIAKLARSETNIEDPRARQEGSRRMPGDVGNFEGLQRTKWWLLLIASVFAVSRSFRLLTGGYRYPVVDWPWHLRSRDDLLLRCPPEIRCTPEQQLSETARINGWSI